MLLNPTTAAISGTGTVLMPSKLLGGVLVTTDGTNAAVIILRKDGPTGSVVFQWSTKTPGFVPGPIGIRDANGSSQQLYYDISGTGATAQLFEYVT